MQLRLVNPQRKSWLFIYLFTYLFIHSLTRSFIYYENRILKVQYKERTRKIHVDTENHKMAYAYRLTLLLRYSTFSLPRLRTVDHREMLLTGAT